MLILGKCIRLVHLISAYTIVGITLIGPANWNNHLLVFWILMTTYNLMYGKCILSQIEFFLTRENKTIVDHCLNILELKTTNLNRKRITVCTGGMMLCISLLRFIIQIT